MKKIKMPVWLICVIVITLIILAQSYISTYIIVSSMEKMIHNITTTGDYPQWFIEWRNTEFLGQAAE